MKGMKLPPHSCWHEGQEQEENNTMEVEDNPDPPKEINVPVEYPV